MGQSEIFGGEMETVNKDAYIVELEQRITRLEQKNADNSDNFKKFSAWVKQKINELESHPASIVVECGNCGGLGHSRAEPCPSCKGVGKVRI